MTPWRTTPQSKSIGVSKTFRLPHERRTTLKEYFQHPLRRTQYEQQLALRRRQLLEWSEASSSASWARTGAARARCSRSSPGSTATTPERFESTALLSPFIELGVGFNPELTARDNIRINGTLLGLSRRQLEERLRRHRRVLRARAVRRPEAQELLVGHAGAARVRDRDPGRLRHPAARRGARGRRRELPAEVLRRPSTRFRAEGKTIVLVTHDLDLDRAIRRSRAPPARRARSRRWTPDDVIAQLPREARLDRRRARRHRSGRRDAPRPMRAVRLADFVLAARLLGESAWLEHAPFAFWLVESLRPATFVELGTHRGFSYLCFCQAIARLGTPDVRLRDRHWEGDEQTRLLRRRRYSQELAAYHDARYSAFSRLVRSTFDDAVPHFDDGSIDLLHLDGLHTYEAVRHDFDDVAPEAVRPVRRPVPRHERSRATTSASIGFGRELRSEYPGFEFVMATASACWAWARKSHHRSQVCSSQPTTRVTWPWCEPRMRASGEPSDSSTS